MRMFLLLDGSPLKDERAPAGVTPASSVSSDFNAAELIRSGRLAAISGERSAPGAV